VTKRKKIEYPTCTYRGEVDKNNLLQGRGTMTWWDGRKYVGDWKNSSRHGRGTYTHPNGTKYIGEWKNGNYHGQGTMRYSHGDRYKGEWKNGIYHGQGTMKYSHGDKYVGQFRDGEPNGKGILKTDWAKFEGTFDTEIREIKDGERIIWNGHGKITSNQGIYKGAWEDLEEIDQGTMTYKDGSKYVGEFYQGSMDGKGTMTLPDGSKYVGDFYQGQRSGQGTHTYLDGTIYSGWWEYDVPDVSGTMIYPDGSKWEGYIKNGERNGGGTITYPDGSKIVGKFKDDFLFGQATKTEPDGTTKKIKIEWNEEKKDYIEIEKIKLKKGMIYEGELVDGVPNGQGTIQCYDGKGTRYEGKFKNGLLNGKGTMTSALGEDRYTGKWKDFKFHGQGSRAYVNALGIRTVYNGNFRNGIKHGKGSIISENGQALAGKFFKNKKRGEFIYTQVGGKKIKLTYKNDKLVNPQKAPEGVDECI